MAGPTADDHAKRAMGRAGRRPDQGHAASEPLGSGSDYSAFSSIWALATLDFGYGGEGRSTGVYHSRYDTYEHHSRFVDPGFVYDALLAKTVGRAVIAAADTDLPIQQARRFRRRHRRNMSTEVKKLADDAARRRRKTRRRCWRTRPMPWPPTPPSRTPIPPRCRRCRNSTSRRWTRRRRQLKTSAKAYDDALAANGAHLSAADQRASCKALMQSARPDPADRTGPAGPRLVQEPDLRARPLHRLWRQDPAGRARGDRGRTLGRCDQIYRADGERAQRL